MLKHQIVFSRAMEAVHHLTDSNPPWQDILRTARDLVGADSGTLIVFDARNKLSNLSAIGFSDACFADYQGHYYRHDVLEHDSRTAPAGTWLDTARMYSSAQLHRTEFYADFMVKHRMAQIISLIVESNSVLHASIGFQRSTIDAKASARLQTGDFAQYFRLLQSQLAQRQKALAIGWKSVESAFSEVNEAVLLINQESMVNKMSTLARHYVEEARGWLVRGGRLRHVDAKTQRRHLPRRPDAINGYSRWLGRIRLDGHQRRARCVEPAWGPLAAGALAAQKRIRQARRRQAGIRVRHHPCRSRRAGGPGGGPQRGRSGHAAPVVRADRA